MTAVAQPKRTTQTLTGKVMDLRDLMSRRKYSADLIAKAQETIEHHGPLLEEIDALILEALQEL